MIIIIIVIIIVVLVVVVVAVVISTNLCHLFISQSTLETIFKEQYTYWNY